MAFRAFVAAFRIDDERAHPGCAEMRIAETARIELRTKFGHSVLVQNVIFFESKMSLEKSVELRFGQAADRSFVPASFHGKATRRQENFAIAKPFENAKKC